MYITSDDNAYRYALGSIGKKTFVVFGINPSTATDTESDRTITRIKSFAGSFGCDGWIVFNLYPQRATDPNELDMELNVEAHKKNLESITSVLSLESEFVYCAAWGNLINKREFLPNCFSDICGSLGPVSWYSIGHLTNSGNPRHPLYLLATEELVPFSTGTYLVEQGFH